MKQRKKLDRLAYIEAWCTESRHEKCIRTYISDWMGSIIDVHIATIYPRGLFVNNQMAITQCFC